MTFAAFETSQASGQPVELYDITLGLTTYRFTSGEDAITFSGNEYAPVAIERSAIAFSGELQRDVLTFTMPASESFPQLYTDVIPSSKGTVTVRRLHRNDGDLQGVLIYKGVVRAVAFSRDATQASITVAPLSNNLARNIPRYSFQILCNHNLYDARCKVVQANFKYDGNVSADTGYILTVDGLEADKGAGWAVGGFVQVGTTDFRMVVAQSGDDLSLILPFGAEGALVGSVVSVFAGCDRTIATCKTKFGNVINYGGWAWVPLINPFEVGLK